MSSLVGQEKVRESGAIRGRGFDAVAGVVIAEDGRGQGQEGEYGRQGGHEDRPQAGAADLTTFLTLLVVPVGYSLLKGARRRKKNYARQV